MNITENSIDINVVLLCRVLFDFLPLFVLWDVKGHIQEMHMFFLAES